MPGRDEWRGTHLGQLQYIIDMHHFLQLSSKYKLVILCSNNLPQYKISTYALG
jgi:hypothetical protein